MKKLITTSLIAASLVSVAHAATPSFTPDVTIYITGATAFRGQVWDILNANITVPDASYNTPKNAGSRSANTYTFMGTWANDASSVSGKKVAIYCGYNGSAEGQDALLHNTPVGFVNILGTATNTATAQLAFSDVKQSSTAYANLTKLVGAEVAVVPFVWVANSNAIAAGVSNINASALGGLLANGYQWLDIFTGKSIDKDNYMNVTGRDNASGTRITMLAESSYGIFKSIQQAYYDSSINDWTLFAPNGGYSSGSNIKTDLNVAAAPACISYLGLSDASGLANGAAKIAYNGVPYSKEATINGQYTFWTYENFFNLPTADSTVTGFKTTLINAISAYFLNTPSDTTTVRKEEMLCKRLSDGGAILPVR